jgi:hypothetical protein
MDMLSRSGSVSDVCQWLNSEGETPTVVAAFENEAVGCPVLLTITEEDLLKHLGIKQWGVRIRGKH